MIRTQPTSFFDRIIVWSLDRPLPALTRYLLCVLIVVTVGVARMSFVPDTLPWLLFIPAAIGIALVPGKGPGLPDDEDRWTSMPDRMWRASDGSPDSRQKNR